MKKINFKSLLYAGTCGLYAFCATAATSLFSDYGQIQNVQNYSTNPFWTPNGPYNQRLPQPVYVQGADLNADDCIKVVQSLVSVQCMARDNCKNTSLADIRPTIMVQLSNLPGNNYVSACSGYIDYIFETYVAQYGNSLPSGTVSFPGATTPNQGSNENNTIQIKNPYKIETPKWYKEVKERGNELKQLQQQNGAGSEHLTATAFPTTYADLSFTERMENATAGYEPYKDASAYIVPQFKNTAEWCSGTEHANSPECIAYNDCTEEMRKSEPNVSRATYTANRVCEITSCLPGYNRNMTHDKCVEINGGGNDGGGNNGGNNGGGNNGGGNNGNGNHNEEPHTEVHSGLCSETKPKISLGNTVGTIFSGIQVQTEVVAATLVRYLIECSDSPNFFVPETNYYQWNDCSGCDDYIFILDKNTGQKMYDVRFDDFKEDKKLWYQKYTFDALCKIAQGSGHDKSCKDITKEKCKTIKTLLESLLGANKIDNETLWYNTQTNECFYHGYLQPQNYHEKIE